MTTVLRVKRRLEESPAEALVVHCKRAKTESIPSVFIFSGTVNEEDDKDVAIKNSILTDKTRQLKDKNKDISVLLQKLKDDKNSSYRNNRIKIINYSRGISLNKNSEDNNNISLLDLHNFNDSEDIEQKFAYDLYLADRGDVEFNDLIDIEGIHPLYGDLVFDTYNNVNEVDDDDEDSNSENNWRNDYPDTEEDESIGDEDMLRAVQNLAIGHELSSDEDDELVYGYSTNTNTRISKDDVDRYGVGYAMYKSKVLKATGESEPQLPQLITYDDSEVREEDSFCYPKYDDFDVEKESSESDNDSESNSLSDLDHN